MNGIAHLIEQLDKRIAQHKPPSNELGKVIQVTPKVRVQLSSHSEGQYIENPVVLGSKPKLNSTVVTSWINDGHDVAILGGGSGFLADWDVGDLVFYASRYCIDRYPAFDRHDGYVDEHGNGYSLQSHEMFGKLLESVDRSDKVSAVRHDAVFVDSFLGGISTEAGFETVWLSETVKASYTPSSAGEDYSLTFSGTDTGAGVVARGGVYPSALSASLGSSRRSSYLGLSAGGYNTSFFINGFSDGGNTLYRGGGLVSGPGAEAGLTVSAPGGLSVQPSGGKFDLSFSASAPGGSEILHSSARLAVYAYSQPVYSAIDIQDGVVRLGTRNLGGSGERTLIKMKFGENGDTTSAGMRLGFFTTAFRDAVAQPGVYAGSYFSGAPGASLYVLWEKVRELLTGFISLGLFRYA